MCQSFFLSFPLNQIILTIQCPHVSWTKATVSHAEIHKAKGQPKVFNIKENEKSDCLRSDLPPNSSVLLYFSIFFITYLTLKRTCKELGGAFTCFPGKPGVCLTGCQQRVSKEPSHSTSMQICAIVGETNQTPVTVCCSGHG